MAAMFPIDARLLHHDLSSGVAFVTKGTAWRSVTPSPKILISYCSKEGELQFLSSDNSFTIGQIVDVSNHVLQKLGFLPELDTPGIIKGWKLSPRNQFLFKLRYE